jgi:predicted permease
MSLLDGIGHRLYVLMRGEAYAQEVDREIQFHLDLEDLSLSGAGAGEASLEVAARRTFGNVTYYREETRSMTLLLWLDRIRQDAGYALRGLARAPGFTTTVVLTLALGVGLNAAVFSLLDRVFVRPPAGVAAPHELRRLYIEDAHTAYGDSHIFPNFNYPFYRAVADAFGSAETVAYTLADSVRPEGGGPLIRRSYVTANYFRLLGVRPTVGRVFGSEEARIETPAHVLVIGERLWRDGFGADPNIVGRHVKTGLLDFTIIGVVPDPFAGLDISAANAWAPLSAFSAGRLSLDGPPWYLGFGNYLRVVARMPTGSSDVVLAAKATAGLRAVELKGYASPANNSVWLGSLIAARGPAKKDSESSISLRLGAVAIIVLLIACANVANLLSMRANRRRREIAVRQALGVSRWRLYEQVITESLLLALIGGIAALALGAWGGALIRKLLFPSVNWAGGTLDVRAVAFVAIASVVAGIMVGTAPAFAGSRIDIISSLRAGSLEGAYRRSTLGSILLVTQTALSIVLLVGAGLFVRSLAKVEGIDLGFDTPALLFANLGVSPRQRFGPETQPAFQRAAEALRRVPGVQSTTLSNVGPMGGFAGARLFRPNGDSVVLGDNDSPTFVSVAPDYFTTVGLRLRQGRFFTDADRKGSEPVMIVNARMAGAFWPNQTAVGQCLVLSKPTDPCVRVVGVVDDAHRMRIIEEPAKQFYVPLAQRLFGAPVLIVRADPRRIGLVVAETRRQLKLAFPEAELSQVRTVSELLERELHPWRLGAQLFTMFGILALVVAAIGVYSVVAYGVSRRTHEMGIRVALGARVADVIGLVVSQGMFIVGLGVGVGVIGALLLGRFVASLLYGVTTRDPVSLVGAIVVLSLCAVAACLVPAWKAARVDPMEALRAE